MARGKIIVCGLFRPFQLQQSAHVLLKQLLLIQFYTQVNEAVQLDRHTLLLQVLDNSVVHDLSESGFVCIETRKLMLDAEFNNFHEI